MSIELVNFQGLGINIGNKILFHSSTFKSTNCSMRAPCSFDLSSGSSSGGYVGNDSTDYGYSEQDWV